MEELSQTIDEGGATTNSLAAMELHELFGVAATNIANVYIADVDITDAGGERYRCDYVTNPDDPYGLGPAVWAAVEAWISLGNSPTPYDPPPTPDPTFSTGKPSIIAKAKLSVVNYEVSTVGTNEGIAGAFQLDEGKFYVMLTAEQPDTDYIVSAFDGGLYRCYVLDEDHFTDSFIITVTDSAGLPANPQCIKILIVR